MSNSLSLELIAQILSHVDGSSLKNSRLVCLNWRWVVDKLFCKFKGLLTDDNLKYIRNSTVHLETLHVCDFKTENLGESSESLSRSKLALSPQKLVFMENTVCSLCPSVSSQNMARILKLNRDSIQSLSFEQNSLKRIKSLGGSVGGLVLKNLTELHIATRMSSGNFDDLNILRELGKLKLPNLSTLKLSSRVVYENEKNLTIWYCNLYEFVAKYRKTLKRLEFRDGLTFLYPNDPTNVGHDNIDNSTVVMSLSFPTSKIELIKSQLAECELTSLSIEFSQIEGYDQACLGFQLLSAQKKLTKLEICRDTELHPSYVHRVADAIETNCGTLSQIVFAYLRDLTPREFSRIARALSMCSGLQTLELMMFNYPSFPFPLPMTLKNLMLVGSLDPNLILVIQSALPSLKTLQFHNVTLDYVLREEEYLHNLRRLATTIPSKLFSVLFSSPQMNYLPVRLGLSDVAAFQDSSKDVCFFQLPRNN